MTRESFKRKLTAILSADVVGYSLLMGKDEASTVRTLTEFRGIWTILIQQHNGKVLDSKGDNLLAEFPSVVEAVLCAVEVQKKIKAQNDKLPKDRRMEFRIGINPGDVIDNGDTIYGDGVNIAARLESLADPGGICISKSAFEHIESKLPFGYEYMGDKNVKNITKPVSAYRILMEPESAGRLFGKKRPKLKKWGWAITTILALVTVGWVIWNLMLRPVNEPGSERNHLAGKGALVFSLDSLQGGKNKAESAEKDLKTQIIFWESVKDSNDRKMYEEYLSKFPDGIFAGLAKININKFSPQNDARTKDSMRGASSISDREENYEVIFWQFIEDSNNIDMFQDYLKRFPDGAFAGLAKIKIETLAERGAEKLAALSKPKKRMDTEGPKMAPKSPELGADLTLRNSKKEQQLDNKPSSQKTAIYLPQEKKMVKTKRMPEELKPDSLIELAVFPWHFKIIDYSSRIGEKSVISRSIDGLMQVFSEYKLVVPKYSYYDLADAINIKDNPLSEAIVNNIWINKSFFSKWKLNLDLIFRLGRQLEVDAVLIYTIFLEVGLRTAEIVLIDVKAKKTFSMKEDVNVFSLSSDIKDLTEKLLVDYVSKKYTSDPNFEMLFWDFIKDSHNPKVFQHYLTKFPEGTFAGLAKLRIEKLSSTRS